MSSDRSREPSDRFITGRNQVLEALRAGTHIREIVILPGARGKPISLIRRLAAERGITTTEATASTALPHLPRGKTQGVIAFAAGVDTMDLGELLGQSASRNEPGFLLIPDHIEDPANLGALLRTAECAGSHGVILARHHAASLSTGTLRSAAGAVEHLRIAVVSNLVNAISELKKSGFWVIGLDGGAPKDYTEADYSGPVALVVGSEGRGIRHLVREHCDVLVRIPLHGRIAALNASVAGALVMFEVRRQRRALHS